jgi:predicted RNA-binding protein with PUA-like domain
VHYWLLKSEPGAFSIDDLNHCPHKTTHWDGVRNYQARNMLRDDMKAGDFGFFYHSNCTPPGIVGIVRIVKEGYPDVTAWDPKALHFDPSSSPDCPRWFTVDVQLVQMFQRIITLSQLKKHPQLKSMLVNRRGNRLSITPVTPAEWKTVIALSQ